MKKGGIHSFGQLLNTISFLNEIGKVYNLQLYPDFFFEIVHKCPIRVVYILIEFRISCSVRHFLKIFLAWSALKILMMVPLVVRKHPPKLNLCSLYISLLAQICQSSLCVFETKISKQIPLDGLLLAYFKFTGNIYWFFIF
jgi:hypothetical protein